MASVWQPVKGMTGKDLEGNRYVFNFFHALDVERVLAEGPWSFQRNFLLLKSLKQNENPHAVVFFKAKFWVQVYGLVSGLRSEHVLKDVGGYAGEFLESDARNFKGGWKTYYRVRVEIDVRKPLKRKMKLRKTGQNGCG